MQIKGLITWLAVVCWELAQAETIRTPDVLLRCDQVKATMVVKKADVKYEYALSSNNVWTQFPDFKIEFEL